METIGLMVIFIAMFVGGLALLANYYNTQSLKKWQQKNHTDEEPKWYTTRKDIIDVIIASCLATLAIGLFNL